MDVNRRDFLKGTAWMGATAALAGCVSSAAKLVEAGGMTAFSVAPIGKVRVGVVGLGMRGPGAVHRLAAIPGVEVAALCDLYPERVAAQQKWLAENGKPKARLMVPAGADKEALLKLAKAETAVAALLEGKTLVKEIAVPGRLVSFVVK